MYSSTSMNNHSCEMRHTGSNCSQAAGTLRSFHSNYAERNLLAIIRQFRPEVGSLVQKWGYQRQLDDNASGSYAVHINRAAIGKRISVSRSSTRLSNKKGLHETSSQRAMSRYVSAMSQLGSQTQVSEEAVPSQSSTVNMKSAAARAASSNAKRIALEKVTARSQSPPSSTFQRKHRKETFNEEENMEDRKAVADLELMYFTMYRTKQLLQDAEKRRLTLEKKRQMHKMKMRLQQHVSEYRQKGHQSKQTDAIRRVTIPSQN